MGTTQFATTTSPSGYLNIGTCGGTSLAPAIKDVWYKFTTAATGLGSTGATITVSGNAAGQLHLFSATSCAGPFTDLGCAAATVSNATAPPLITTVLTANTTYYVRVSGYDGLSSTGPFTICLTDGPGFVACAMPAIGLPVYSAGNTTATFSFTPAANNAGPYTATLQFNPLNPPGPTPVPFPATPPTVTVTGLVPGNNYTLTVQGLCTTGGTVTGIQTFTVPVLNDEPCGAVVLPVDPGAGCTPLSGFVTGATPTVPNGYTNPGCGGVANALDVWYRFTTTTSGPGSTSVVLTLSNVAAAGQLRLFAAPSCTGPFTSLACSAASSPVTGAAPIVATGLVPNTTYYVSVAGITNALTNTFTLCASALVPALPCPALDRLNVPAALLTPTTAPLALIPVTGTAVPVSYTVTYTPQGGSPVVITVPYVPVAGGIPPYTLALLTSLLPGTTYTVTAVVNCTGGSQSGAVSTTFTTPPATGTPPANDECASATPLTVGTTCVSTTTTNLNATDSFEDPPLCSNYQGGDVWFSAVVPANGIVQFTSGAASGSIVTSVGLQLFTGSCGNLVLVACNGGNAVAFAQVRAVGLVPGSTVHARAWRQGSAAGGAFTICATTDITCPLITNLTPTAVMTTSATLTFTLPAGNTGYVLTYTPAGGTAQTQTITASPVVLTGLTPGTTYAVSITGSCTGSVAGTVRTSFTTPVVPTCAVPAAVYASNVGNTSAGVGFVLTSGASSYTVTYQAAGGPIQTVSPAPTSSPVTLAGVVPGTSYTVCVTSNCTNGLASTPQCALPFTTTGTAPTCAAPTGATAASTGPTTARVSFTPTAGVTSYTVTYTAAGGSAQTLTPNPTASPVVLTGLLPGVAYTVTVASNCPSGPASLPVLATFATPLASRSGALADQLSLYPNPAHHSATLTVPAALLRQASLLTLSDALGRTVRQRYVTPTAGTAADTRAELDLTGLPTGVYLVRLLSNAGPLTKRLVIE
ncbi:fibronectin type III domain-containing protein [Hymenobacter terricola]|uniref:fibronectin type III domain-containing protein n=1 Tax=Hymenobacter terricola TaxID=2819236 RepID=UPI001CF5D970|nr:fibronectin type III domain-containing protein [Hymenobacter terricola]